MTTMSGLLSTILAEQTAEQIFGMRVALITIAALAATNLLLVILIVASRKKKAD